MKAIITVSYIVLAATSMGSCLASELKTRAQWERCVSKTGASVNQAEVGVMGVEAKIKAVCGEPPVVESATGEGAQPYNLIRSKQWRPKFAVITQSKYKAFTDRLAVASATTRDGTWLTGSGQMPHMGGTDEAAFAINTKTEEVFAVMLEDGKKLSIFSAVPGAQLPPFLVNWIKEHKI